MYKNATEKLTKLMVELNQLPESELDLSEDFEVQLARLYKKLRKRKRRANGAQRKKSDREAVAEIAARRKRQLNQPVLGVGHKPVNFQHRQRTCYSCNEKYQTVHPNYHWLCVPCGDLSASKRSQTADLRGYKVMLTGGRIKIGFETAVWLLRCGATVHVTTRFPADAAIRYSELADFEEFEDRLHIHAIDFRNLPRLVEFIKHFKNNEDSLDILINHAAQSVKRSETWYQRRVEFEQQVKLHERQTKLLAFDGADGNLIHGTRTKLFSETNPMSLISAEERDDDDRLDQREKNTWNSNLIDTPPLEILETLLINANGPALLTRGLHDLLKSSVHPASFIVNVTGADGLFALSKSGYHPHVNMSKAAMNMMTRTCAPQFAKEDIYINSVDTGWITHEGSYSYRKQRESENFLPPYDHRDGAARILDPIFQVVNENAEPVGGIMYRNFKPFHW